MVNQYKSPIPYRSFKGKKMGISLTFLASLLLFSVGLFAQDATIKGKVIDSGTGETLPGVNIVVKGTSNGTATDSNGEFSLSVPANGTILASFVGYKTSEIAINGRTTIDISLESDIETLTEVVVVGYGSVEKKDVTGMIAKVDTKDFNKGLINAPDQLLTGKVAGLQITPNGEPGGQASIRLRGPSINGEYPLIVVDGVPLDGGGGGVAGSRNPLNFINNSDIADITVLKDASASAIYGARGANGVIIITTKSGKTGKPVVSYDGSYSGSFYTNKPDILSSDNYRAIVKKKAPQEFDNLGTANTDWLKEVTQYASSTQHNISLNGGTKKIKYFTSANYLLNNGVLRFTRNEKINLSGKVNFKLLKDKLDITVGEKFGHTNDLFGPNVMGGAVAFDPTQPVYDASNVDRGGYFQWGNPLATTNPVSSQDLQHNTGTTTRSLTNLNLKYEIPYITGLSVNVNAGYDHNKGNYNSYVDPKAKESLGNGGSTYDQNQKRVSQLYDLFGNYKKTFGNHKIDLTVGYGLQKFTTTQDNVSSDSLLFPNTTDVVIPVTKEVNAIESYFARLNYDFGGKYLITASIRRDESSKFGPAVRKGYFPAVAVAWRILEENFASGLATVFDELKFRGSYGVTGNDQIQNYQYATYYYPSVQGGSYQFGNQYIPTLRPKGVDPDIKWEETVSTNIGIDAGFLNGRLTASLDYYDKTTNDVLFQIAVPVGSNLSDVVTTNIGTNKNRGVELTLTAVAVDKTDFKWNLSFNASYNKNTITKLDNLQGNDLTNFIGYRTGGISGDVGQVIQVKRVGYPINSFLTYKHKRNADGSLVLDTDGDGIQEPLEMYEDINNDQIINEKDLVLDKKPFPTVIMGLTSSMTYKKFDFSITLRSNIGNSVYNNVSSANGFYQRLTQSGVTNNVHASVLETNFKEKQLFSDYYVQDGSFLKVDNISIGYNFDNLSFGKIRAYVTGQNIAYLTSYKGVTPEVDGGIDNNVYPRSLTVSIGVNATFK